MNFAKRAAELSEEIIAHRHYLHQHAELSFQEKETTAYLVSQLEKLGIPVQSFPDYTGCIATIQGGQPGKTVLLRADIDALPIQENSGVDFESIHPGDEAEAVPPRPRLHRLSSVTAAIGIVIATSAFHVQPHFLSSQFWVAWSQGFQNTSFTRVVRRHRRVKLLYHSFSPLCKRPEGRIQVKFRENPSAPLHLRGGFHHIDVAAPRL